MSVSGTKEWSAHSVNCYVGCPHNCRYCYARAMALRFGTVQPGEWEHPRLRESEVRKKRRRVKGTTMFPTTHDITPEMLEPCLSVLRKLLAAGNRVLLVSKPHLSCIERICQECRPYREQLLFRFTIGATSDRFLSYWEPGAPPFAERLAALKLARSERFETSVSAEPCLDFAHVDQLIEAVLPWITDAIWIGKLNKARERTRLETDQDRQAVDWIIHAQRDEVLRAVYERWEADPRIKWKESIKKVVGLPLASKPGLDV